MSSESRTRGSVGFPESSASRNASTLACSSFACSGGISTLGSGVGAVSVYGRAVLTA